VGMLLSSPAGNDLLFDESYCEQGRNFANKVWNAFRLIKGFEVGDVKATEAQKSAVVWFEHKLAEQIYDIDDHYSKYRMSDALMATYKLVWDDFCAWYLEAIKPEFVDGKAQPIDKNTYDATIYYLEKLLALMHPWMPFITEEIWHLIKERNEKDCCILAKWPDRIALDHKQLEEFEITKELVTTIRNVRAQKQISPKEKLSLIVRTSSENLLFDAVTIKLSNLSELKHSTEKVDSAFSFVIKNREFFVPLSMDLDIDEERGRIIKEIDYNKGFLKSVQAKLANEKFVSNAKPELVELERKKEADALGKIKTLEDQLSSLK